MASLETPKLKGLFESLRNLWFEHYTLERQRRWWWEDPRYRLGRILEEGKRDLEHFSEWQRIPRCEEAQCQNVPTKVIFTLQEYEHNPMDRPAGYFVYACPEHEADVRERWKDHPLYPYFIEAQNNYRR